MAPSERALRRLILLVFYLGAVGVVAELLLLEHYETAVQLSPFLALALGAAGMAAAGLRPGPGTIRVARAAAVVLGVAGVAGLYFHYRGNIEFELEAYPDLGGLALAWEAVRGATPALAPGVMVQLALLGLAYTYRHPASRRDAGHLKGTTE